MRQAPSDSTVDRPTPVGAPASETAPPAPLRLDRGKRWLLAIVLAVGAAAGSLYYWYRQGYESTDNAFIEGGIIQISPRIPGQVLRVLVTDNQRVEAGQLLVELDPKDYRVAVEQARAALSAAEAQHNQAKAALELTRQVTAAALIQAQAAVEAARAQADTARAGLKQAEASVQAAEAALRQAEARRAAAEAEAQRASADLERFRALYAKDEVSRQQLDQVEAGARAAAANLEAASQAVEAARAQLSQAQAAYASAQAAVRQAERAVQQAEGKLREAQAGPAQVRAREADLAAAQAALERARAALQQAELQLAYTKIHAPEPGYIAKKSVEPGNTVAPGQALMALVTDRLWVVANFKEVQLRRMRPGQPVTIKIDAYPDYRFRGRVESIQAGSGARFSLLPPENATGNYVKVVQRVPVKIVFEDPLPKHLKIGPGMSVVPTVKVR